MRLAFSTLGCPAWTLDQILQSAVDYGYDGVEIRGIQEHVDLRQSPLFTSSERAGIRRRFEDSGLSICCLGSSASFAAQDRRGESMDEARAYMDIAAEIGSPLVRVFGGTPAAGQPHRHSICSVADCLSELAPYAEERSIALTLETHDAFSTGRDVAEVLNLVNHPTVGALWDLHHPFREGESPEETDRFLGPFLKHCHVKDSRNGEYCLLGDGDVPIKAILALISQRLTNNAERPTPWLSLEWEKRWHPEIGEPELVFPQYAAKLREYLREVG